MTPSQFSDFVGPDRVKTRLELAIAEAKRRGASLGHVLLIGSPAAGPATLARLIASTLGQGLKFTRGPEIENAGDLARLATSLEKGDVLLIDEIHRLPATIEAYLCPALNEFKLYLPLDQGGYTRPFRLNLPVFTLIGAAPHQEQLSPILLSQFPIVESLAD